MHTQRNTTLGVAAYGALVFIVVAASIAAFTPLLA